MREQDNEDARALANEILAQNDGDALAALYDAALWILEIEAQRRSAAASAAGAGFVRGGGKCSSSSS